MLLILMIIQMKIMRILIYTWNISHVSHKMYIRDIVTELTACLKVTGTPGNRELLEIAGSLI